MAQNTATVDLWACVDSNGDYAVGSSDEAAREKYEEDVGALNEVAGFRLVKVAVTVPLPEVIELEVEAPAEEAQAAAAVA